MNNQINVTKTFLPPINDYSLALKKIWDSFNLTNRGDTVIELEEKIQKFLNCKSKPLLVCNGTIALQLAIKALSLKGEIITTPFSYVATTSSIVWENCQPVFVDINSKYLTIDETKIEAAITKNTTAILATHVYGNPCEVEAIDKIAKKYNLKVIYDAAHCFGINYNGKSIFEYGDISICSFHATKIFHTGEGGAVFSNNEKLSDTLFNLHNFGHFGTENFHSIGINGKMSELNAVMGLSILPYMDHIIKERIKLVDYYNKNLKWTNFNKLEIRENTSYNYSYYPIIFNTEEILLKYQKKLNDNNIFPRRYFYPSLNLLPYVNYVKMPIAECVSKRVLCLPLYSELKKEHQNKVCDLLSLN